MQSLTYYFISQNTSQVDDTKSDLLFYKSDNFARKLYIKPYFLFTIPKYFNCFKYIKQYLANGNLQINGYDDMK